MIDCNITQYKNIVIDDIKVGEVPEIFSCTLDQKFFSVEQVDDQEFLVFKTLNAGDVMVFWFACFFVMATMVIFIIKFVRNKNVF